MHLLRQIALCLCFSFFSASASASLSLPLCLSPSRDQFCHYYSCYCMPGITRPLTSLTPRRLLSAQAAVTPRSVLPPLPYLQQSRLSRCERAEFNGNRLLTAITRRTATTMSDPINRLPLRNRCAESKSPYVRSHIDNPTAWQLWTPETLELAKETNRLLFVSIGYSACHWW